MDQIRCLGSYRGERFVALQGDCVDVLAQMPDDSVGLSVYSPPFGSLFVYSASVADMGNSTDREFAEHYAFMVREKFRVTMPGRLTAVHCSDLPMTKWKDGAIGIKDFSGQIIRIHEEAGSDFARAPDDLEITRYRNDPHQACRASLQAATQGQQQVAWRDARLSSDLHQARRQSFADFAHARAIPTATVAGMGIASLDDH